MMDWLRIIVLLLHPMLGTFLIAWMLKQHGWRGRSTTLKGEDRKAQREQHERWGQMLLKGAALAVILAFCAQLFRAWREGVALHTHLIPSVHGIFGLLGLGLLYYMTRLGLQTRDAREAGQSWDGNRLKHGRAADLVMILAVLHGFIGFLYIFEVL